MSFGSWRLGVLPEEGARGGNMVSHATEPEAEEEATQ
jgi:hypothetical protein